MGVARPLPPLAIHGRLPPRKGFVASGARVSAAAIHPVSTAAPAAGLDEFRGPAPDHKRGLFRPWQATGSADPGPPAHAILDCRPRSPWKPFRGGPTRPGLRLGRASLPEPRSRPAPAHAAAAR